MTKELLSQIAEYTNSACDFSENALFHAKLSLLDSIGCMAQALQQPNCVRFLDNAIARFPIANGVPVLGTTHILDPVNAAFYTSGLIRWLDFNDTWLSLEWSHPSDNIGGILAASFAASKLQNKPVIMHDLLINIVKAYEIQGKIATSNCLNKHGFDHVLLVKIATASIATKILGGNLQQIKAAISNALADGASLRIYRHGDNTNIRKSWAAADATARGLQLAWFAVMADEPGYLGVITEPDWGFNNRLLPLNSIATLGSEVIENILYKVVYPAEFHGQTAIEAAIALRPQVVDKFRDIGKVVVHTQSAAMRIINKEGILANESARDHCLQYMMAVALLYGTVTSKHYTGDIALNPELEQLRRKVKVIEEPQYSKDYLAKGTIANAVQIVFKDGSYTAKQEILYPLGHARRRREALPRLKEKYQKSLQGKLSNLSELWDIPLHEFSKVSLSDLLK